MAYTPSLNDLDDTPSPRKYMPSLNDLPNDIQQNQSNFDPSFMEKLAPNILAGTAQLGHELLNAPHNIANLFSPDIASHIPKQKDYNFSEMLKLPGTTADKVIQGLASSLPSIFMPELKLGQVGQAISKLPMAGKYLEGAIGRMLPQAGFGAATSEDPLKGAATMAAMQGVGEVIPAALKSIGGAAEFMNPKKYASQLGDIFSKDYARAREKAGKFYNSVTDKLGDIKIYQDTGRILLPGEKSVRKEMNYKGLDEGIIDKYFTPKVKKLHEDFMENPNLNNAHRLQSQLGSEASRLSRAKPDAVNIGTQQSMEHARTLLNKDIKSFLMRKDENAAKSWELGNAIFKNEAAPYRSSAALLKLAKGERQSISPLQAKNALTKVMEEGSIPEGHLIGKAHEDLNRKINRGKALESLIPAKTLLHQLPDIMGFAQNPYISGKFSSAHPYYEKLKNSIISSQLQGM